MGFILSWLEPEVKRSKIWALRRWRQLSSFISTFLSPPSPPKNILPFTIWDNSVKLALCQVIWIVKDPMMWNTIKRAFCLQMQRKIGLDQAHLAEPPTSNSFLAKLTNPWELLLIPLGIQPFIYYFMSKIDPPRRAPSSMLDINYMPIAPPPPSSLSIPMVQLLKGWIPGLVSMVSRQLVDSLTTAWQKS